MRIAVGFIAGLGLVLVVSGCATPARTSSMVPEVRTNQAVDSDSPLYRGIWVIDVGGGQETNPLWTSEVGTKEFRESLVRTLELQGFLAAGETAAFRLKAFIVEVKHPSAGISVTVHSFIRYALVRSTDGKVIFDDVLSGSFTATVSDTFYGVDRLRLAEEGSIRANISALVERLHATVIPE